MEALTIKEYKVEFEAICNRLHRVYYPNKQSYFLNGMKDEIRLPIWKPNPPDLLIAFSLAKIQEEHVKISRKGFKSHTIDLELGMSRRLTTKHVRMLVRP